MNQYKSVEFLSSFRMSSPLHKRKAPVEDFLATVLLVIYEKYKW